MSSFLDTETPTHEQLQEMARESNKAVALSRAHRGEISRIFNELTPNELKAARLQLLKRFSRIYDRAAELLRRKLDIAHKKPVDMLFKDAIQVVNMSATHIEELSGLKSPTVVVVSPDQMLKELQEWARSSGGVVEGKANVVGESGGSGALDKATARLPVDPGGRGAAEADGANSACAPGDISDEGEDEDGNGVGDGPGEDGEEGSDTDNGGASGCEGDLPEPPGDTLESAGYVLAPVAPARPVPSHSTEKSSLGEWMRS